MSLRDKVISGVRWSAVQNWGGHGLSLIVFLVLARLLEPSLFGLVAMAGVFIAFVDIFVDQGFGTALIQREDLQDEHLDTAFWSNIAVGGLLALSALAGAGLVARFFGEPELEPVIQWLSLSFVFSAASGVQQSLLRRNFAFRSLAARTMAGNAIGGVAGVGMALSGMGVWSLVGYQLTRSAVSVLVLWTSSEWRPSLRFSWRHFIELLRFGANIIGHNLVSFVPRQVDHLIIGYTLGAVSLGYYTLAQRLFVSITTMLIGTTQAVALPTFARLQSDHTRLRSALHTAVRLTSYVAFPVYAGMGVLAPELVLVGFGEEWGPSAPVLQVFSIIGFLFAGFFYNAPVMMAVGRPSWALAYQILNAAGNAVAYSLAVSWGIVAVAAGYVVRGYLMIPLALWMLHRLIRLDVLSYLRQYLGAGGATAVASITMWGLAGLLGPLGPHIVLGGCAAAGGAVYLLVMFVVDRGSLSEAVGIARTALTGRGKSPP